MPPCSLLSSVAYCSVLTSRLSKIRKASTERVEIYLRHLLIGERGLFYGMSRDVQGSVLRFCLRPRATSLSERHGANSVG